MEFRLLGPLEVRKDERLVPVGGAKQRALLAILLLHANEVVSRDRLFDELWGDRQPGTSDRSLDHQVSRLRKTLDPSGMLVTRSGGYVLEVEPEQIDISRFEQLFEEGRRANAAGNPAHAAHTLREALALWRGDALADLAYASFARGEIERLEELRLAALEERIDAELALGHHRALVAELELLTSKHPLRERLRGQQMLALYRSGRETEALRVYADTRRRLVEELGIEPGEALRQLEQAILRHEPSLDIEPAAAPSDAAQTPLPRRPRPALLTALVLVIAAVAAAAGIVLANGGTQSSHAQSLAEPDSIALVAAKSGEVIGQARAVPSPALALFGEAALWNVSFTGELSKIDPATGQVVTRLNTGVQIPCGLAVGEGSVWVTDCNSPTLVQIDPAQTVVADRIRLPSISLVDTATGEVAVGAGSVWVARGFANPSWVERLDSATGRVQQHILIPVGGAQRLAFGDGALWVGGDVDAPDVPKLSKIDPRTNEVTPALTSFGNAFSTVAAGGGFVWGATTPDHTVWKIGEDGSLVAPVKLAAAVESLTYAEGAVWAAGGEAGTVVRIDPITNATKTYTLGHDLRSVAVRKGIVAVGVQPSGGDVTSGLEGRIVHVALASNYLDWTSTDPAATQTAFNPWQVQFQYATCAKLFNYPDASGAAGKRLTPEVAASWPVVTDGGRTYTFHIRRGYRFSPPSGEAVTAESFRHAIERFLSPRMQPEHWSLDVLPELVGARAFHAGKVEHIAGVSAKGDMLVIRLVRPAPDLPTRLALPAFCAVTAKLPTVLHGIPIPIPSAGPYYLADRSANVVVLKPNPNYRGPRPHTLDAIVYEMNVDAGGAVVQVEQGKVDYVQEVDPVLAPSTAVARGAGLRYRLTPDKWTAGLVLNTHRPLFANARLRRAVAHALDRRALASGVSVFAVPTSHVLPPNVPGFEDGPSYSLSSDLRKARRLAGRLRSHAVFAVGADAAGVIYDTAVVKRVRDQLARIGIDVTVLPLPQSSDDRPDDWSALLARADIALVSRNASQADDPVTYLASLPPYLPAADRAKLTRIATFGPPRRQAAAAAFASRLERDGVYVAYADFAHPELVSKRLGCVIDHPEYPGVDLAALCLRSS